MARAATNAPTSDRVAQLFEGTRRRTHEIVTPEGVALRVEVAGAGERLGAVMLDILFFILITIALYLAIFFALVKGLASDVLVTLVVFIAFLVRLFYFIYFELTWRGRTPGKRIVGLRVVDRNGGSLTAAAIVARNLVREVEIFLPLGLFVSLAATTGMETWERLTTFAWIVAIALVPFFNRDRLRAGDLIAGTMVIAMPHRQLDSDLATDGRDFVFTPEQLAAYGAFELQVLEELLRQTPSQNRTRLLREVTAKICRRIAWTQEIPPTDTERFLRAFYTAERADLERARLFGRDRADKDAGAV